MYGNYSKLLLRQFELGLLIPVVLFPNYPTKKMLCHYTSDKKLTGKLYIVHLTGNMLD